jgi:hypothetical protein
MPGRGRSIGVNAVSAIDTALAPETVCVLPILNAIQETRNPMTYTMFNFNNLCRAA